VIAYEQQLAHHAAPANVAQRAVLATGGGLAGPGNPVAIDHGRFVFLLRSLELTFYCKR
jgi:hypothetical protein